ncbi:putative phage abortive infection protein [Paenibacillus sp. FSL R7-0179]|uniref:putative phage abortive infection protein n=1 Tax=Paenibacillus sp. FSL R7-0179 TaxID=2921672 RepID=UPI0030F8E259
MNNVEEIKFFRLLISIGIVWFLSGLIFLLPFGGEYGDKFGVINTLFSGLAFGGIIYTIYQQRAEFGLQREELKLQREEVAKTNLELEAQVRSINVQRFENTFFHLISLHNEITKSIPDNQKYTGRGMFIPFHIELTSIRKVSQRDNSTLNELELIKGTCDTFFKRYEQSLGHYYRNLYNLFRMVDRNEWIEDLNSKKEYTRIIRSQLSAYEYVFLFYNCFQKKGYKFKAYADKYELFDNMNEELLLDGNHIYLYRNLLDETIDRYLTGN